MHGGIQNPSPGRFWLGECPPGNQTALLEEAWQGMCSQCYILNGVP